MSKFAEITDAMGKEFYHKGNNIGVLMIHGYGATPAQLLPIAHRLSDKGYTVLSILLPGHGTSVEDMEKSNWQQWLRAARDGYHRLADSCDKIFVGGISLGGLLTLILAYEIPIAGMFTIGAVYESRLKGSALAGFVWPIIKYSEWKQSEYTDESMAKYNVCYEVLPTKNIKDMLRLRRMAQLDIGKIYSPMLIMQGEHDSVARPTTSQKICDQAVNAPSKEVLILKDSPHVATTGPRIEEIWSKLDEFIDKNK